MTTGNLRNSAARPDDFEYRRKSFKNTVICVERRKKVSLHNATGFFQWNVSEFNDATAAPVETDVFADDTSPFPTIDGKYYNDNNRFVELFDLADDFESGL